MTDTAPPPCPADQEPFAWFLWTRLHKLTPEQRHVIAKPILDAAWGPESRSPTKKELQ